jgi:predicted dehydrogenase
MFEKPLANTLEEAIEIAELAEASGSTCYVAFKHRCSNAVKKVRELAESGDLGDIYHIEATNVATRAIPAIGDWMTTRNLSGGGALIDLGTHTLDAALFVGDFRSIESATGVARQQFDPANYDPEEAAEPQIFGDPGDRVQSDVEDSMSSLVEFTAGKSIALETHWAANLPNRREFWVYGSEGGCRIDLLAERVELYDYNEQSEPATVFETADPHTPGEMVIDEFLETIGGGESVLAGLAGGIEVQRIIEEVYVTAR